MRQILRPTVLTLTLAFVTLAFAQLKPANSLLTLEKVYKSTKATFQKQPKSAKIRTQYVAATVKFGTATMNADSLAPRVKYAGALRLYREALKLDPKNSEALKNKKLIEDIYKSMGREIPK